MDVLITANKTLIERTERVLGMKLPFRFWLTVVLNKRPKNMRKVVVQDLQNLSISNDAIIQPIVGVNTLPSRVPHFHAILLCSSSITTNCLTDKYSNIDFEEYIHDPLGLGCARYTLKKHEDMPLTLFTP